MRAHAQERLCATNVSLKRYTPHHISFTSSSMMTCRATPEESSSGGGSSGNDVMEDVQQGEVSSSGSTNEAASPAKDVYVKPQMSKEQREKLRQEYLGLGGSAGTAMSTNWFLNICVGISVLAVLTKLTGALG